MTEPLTIEIRGARGAGKTTLAIVIAQQLRSLGLAVTYDGWHPERIEELIAGPDHSPALHEPRRVRLVDDVDA